MGVRTVGRGNKTALRPDQVRRVRARLAAGDKVAQIARDMRVDSGALMREIRSHGVEPTALGFFISKR